MLFGAGGLVIGLAEMVVVPGSRANGPAFVSSAVTLGAAWAVGRIRPAQPLLTMFAAFAASLQWIFVLMSLLSAAIDDQASGMTIELLTIAQRAITGLSISTAMRLFVRFPDGRHSKPVDRWAIRVVDVMQVVACGVLLLTPTVAWPTFLDGAPVANPVQPSGFSVDVDLAGLVVEAANSLVIIALVLVLHRYRRATSTDRKSLRWLLLPLVAAFFAIAVDVLLDSEFAGLVVSAALGVGLAFGMVNPDGVDVDDVLRRTMVVGLLWLGIGAAYVGVAAAFGITIGRRWSLGWAVATTAAAMLALQRPRARLERRATRRMFGRPTDPQLALQRLGDSLANTYDLEALLPEISSALEEGLEVEWARIRVSPHGESDDVDPAMVVPIRLDGVELGAIECGPRRDGILGPDHHAVVATFARQAALAIRNVRLTMQLRDRTHELAASRAQLVRVEEDERRRIERNIHDGVQQDLVALIGQAGLLHRRATQGEMAHDDDMVAELQSLRVGLQRVLAELRELAAGIHPSVLRDRGLLAAVEGLAARHPVPVDVIADAELRGRRLPAEVEGAGYYTVAESLANALKHADADRLTITLVLSADAIHLQIDDDGVGFRPEHVSVNGLANLTNRLAALDGRLCVESRPSGGTSVSATVPIESSPRDQVGAT